MLTTKMYAGLYQTYLEPTQVEVWLLAMRVIQGLVITIATYTPQDLGQLGKATY